MMTATACPSTGQLRAYTLGELPEEQSNELFLHVQDCDHCRTELETVDDADAEDSLIASLRATDPLSDFDHEPDCKLAVAKALGALASGQTATTSEWIPLPQTIGEYEIIRPLGRGGMGSVYLAQHTKLGREVALKVLAGHRLADPRMRERFEGEMRAVGRLSHPNIVTAHDAREVGETSVLVTEYIDGLDLGEIVSRIGPLSVNDACEIIRKVAVALQYTSDQGFVHRDVKPSNIMISRNGEVKLLDLGLARWHFDDHDRPEITGSGQAMGTADYVAPEQINDSRSVDVRADVYSLGCTLFKLLTGQPPFHGPQHATAFAKMTAHVSANPPSLADIEPSVPARLVKLADGMLAKDPANRPQTPMAVAEQLGSFTSDADLQALVKDAIAHDGPRNVHESTSPSRPATKPWYSRRVPWLFALGTGLMGILLGTIFGIVIHIKYPDQTEVFIPLTPGAKVEFQQVPDAPADKGHAEAEAPARALTPPAAETKRNSTAATPVYSPLAFVVLVERDDLSPKQFEAAKKRLQEAGGGQYVSTDVGTWFRVADEVNVPISDSFQGQRYTLTTNDRRGSVTWGDIQGHIVNVQKDRVLTFRFDDELAKRMGEVTGNHLNRQLAIVIDKRIISAPFIQSKITHSTVVTGNLSREGNDVLVSSDPRRTGHSDETPQRARRNATKSERPGSSARYLGGRRTG